MGENSPLINWRFVHLLFSLEYARGALGDITAAVWGIGHLMRPHFLVLFFLRDACRLIQATFILHDYVNKSKIYN